LSNYFGGWATYTFVFPISVSLMLYSGSIVKYLSSFYEKSKIGLITLWVLLIVIYFLINKFRTPFFIAFIVVSIGVIDKLKIIPSFLNIIGRYSYEVYLLHLPFVTNYNIMCSRKPFIVNLGMYLVLLMVLGVILKEASRYFNQRMDTIFSYCASHVWRGQSSNKARQPLIKEW
jgi:peptidoglycan/LPS O-acetylase OafA/YrhL